MAQADSQSMTHSAFLRSPETAPAGDKLTLPPPVPVSGATGSGSNPSDPILAAIEAHRHALDQRNQTIEAICAAEDRYKSEERDAWHRYEEASIALLTTKPTTMAGVIAMMNYVAQPECSGPGICETILDGARLSSNREAAAAAERFPALSAEVLQEIAVSVAKFDNTRVAATLPRRAAKRASAERIEATIQASLSVDHDTT